MVFCKISITKRGNYNILTSTCSGIYFTFSSVCHIKRVIKYIGIVICIHILLERLLISIVSAISAKPYSSFKVLKRK